MLCFVSLVKRLVTEFTMVDTRSGVLYVGDSYHITAKVHLPHLKKDDKLELAVNQQRPET